MKRWTILILAVLLAGCAACRRCDGGCNDASPIEVPRNDVDLIAAPCGPEPIVPILFDLAIRWNDGETSFAVMAIPLGESRYHIAMHSLYLLAAGDNVIRYRAKSLRPNTVPGEWDEVTLRYGPPPTPTPAPQQLGRYSIISVESGRFE